jgi:hypothetical protein
MKTPFTHVTISHNVSADTFGCTVKYFRDFIQNKKLKIIYESSFKYIRVTDENQEEWGLYEGQYTLVTGLASKATHQKTTPKQKNPLPQNAAKIRGSS